MKQNCVVVVADLCCRLLRRADSSVSTHRNCESGLFVPVILTCNDEIQHSMSLTSITIILGDQNEFNQMCR